MSARLHDPVGHAFGHWRLDNRGPQPLIAAFRAGFEFQSQFRATTMNHQDATTTLRLAKRRAYVDPLFPVLRHMTRDVLNKPFDRAWSIQGFGMLRTYFGPDKQFRLNVWHSRFQVPGVSIVHDHPWHFNSWIIAGRFTNQRYTSGTLQYGGYRVSAAPPNFHFQTIKTGEGGGPVGELGSMLLIPDQPEQYRPGDTYRQEAHEIHASFYNDGTVTLNDRTRIGDGEHARVFWPLGEKWIDAQPRNATEEEVWTATRAALAWFK